MTDDLLTQATEALRDAPVPAGPPADLIAATVAACRADSPRTTQRRRAMRYLRYAGLATAAAVLAGAGLFLTAPRESAAAEVKRALANAEKAKSMRVVLVRKSGEQETTETLTVRGPSVRVDITDGTLPPGEKLPDPRPPVLATYVADLEEMQSIHISHVHKTGTPGVVPPPTDGGGFPDLVGGFRRLRDEPDMTAAGSEKVGAVAANKYTFKAASFLAATGPADVTLWVDPKTSLPVRVRVEEPAREVTATVGDKAVKFTLPAVTQTFDRFEFDVKLADGVFGLGVPKGYKALKADTVLGVPVEGAEGVRAKEFTVPLPKPGEKKDD